MDVIENDQFRKLLLRRPGKAIAILYDLYYRSLMRIAFSLSHDLNVAEDIVQDTFVHVWENHKKLGQHYDRSIQHYLVRVVKNKAITYYKRNYREIKKRNELSNGHVFQHDELSVEGKIIRSEIAVEVRKLITTFPTKERECLLMKMDEELTTEQIAQRMNVTKKAVERSLTSANKRLRKLWASRR